MATPAIKIDSNVTGLRYAKESSVLKVLPGSPIWYPLEPNSYNDFGGDVKLLPRNPINASRQRKKGVVVDVEASAAFTTDLTQTNSQDLMQGLFYAAFRRKVESGQGAVGPITSTSTTQYLAAANGLTAFRVGDLVKGNNFTNSGNNAMQRVTAVVTGALTVAALTAEAAPPSTAFISQVGFEFAASDANISIASTYPRLTTTTKDCTQFGLTPGEIVFVGGDLTAEKFGTAANNGFCRVRSVAAGYIEFDKTASTMANETATGKTIRIFFGRVIKNETVGTSIVRSTYQLERTLGASDIDVPAQIQAEYNVGSVLNKAMINVPTADKVTLDIEFLSLDSEKVSGVTGVKAGTRPALVENDAFNTSSDVTKIKLAQVVAGNANPTALFTYVENAKIEFMNNATLNRAVGTLGGFEITAGTFEVGGEINAYFTDIAAQNTVRTNADITLEMHLVKANAGISIDLPLIAMSDARAKVEQDAAVMVPLKLEAATGAKVNAATDHTALIVFFDYLPSAADS